MFETGHRKYEDCGWWCALGYNKKSIHQYMSKIFIWFTLLYAMNVAVIRAHMHHNLFSPTACGKRLWKHIQTCRHFRSGAFRGHSFSPCAIRGRGFFKLHTAEYRGEEGGLGHEYLRKIDASRSSHVHGI